MRGAMIGGAGYMAGKSKANSAAQEQGQEQRIAELESQQAPPPPPPPPPAAAAPAAPAGPSMIEQLSQLGELRDKGILTADEFEREKQKLLAS
jgi:hypothetical protein